MKITFYGAAQNVTGSKHVIDTQGYKILLDCGLHQGKKEVVNELNRTLPFKAADIDAVLLSHGHADHCGMLPVLVKQGFVGKIYSTPATRDVAEYILKDSAKIQEQDANYINDHLGPGEDPVYPLYTVEDVEAALPFFHQTPYFWHTKQWTRISDRIRFKFYDAGHILGSSVAVVEITENEKTHTIAFTGDLGHRHTPILRDPEVPEERIDVLITECTYGNRTHRPLEEAKKPLADLIRHAFKHKSKIIVPAFSLGRTQELIYVLHQLTDSDKIPRLPIYIDSPLAGNLSEVFNRHTEEYDMESWHDFSHRGEPPLAFKNLYYTQSIEDSKHLNEMSGPFMIISASGMCEGGRILHHLKNNIEDPNNIIMFTGFQAQGTLGRRILEGISPVRILTVERDVRARIVQFNEFSAHADQQQLLEYIGKIQGPQQTYLVHAEKEQAETFVPLLQHLRPNTHINIPEHGQTFEM